MAEAVRTPDWLSSVLGDSEHHAPLHRADGKLLDVDGQSYASENGVLFLTRLSRDELDAFGSRFVPPEKIEHVLRPQQIRFRRLLRNFVDALPAEAVVVDIASADAEFAPYYDRCRYVPMDLAYRRLEYAVERGRISFGVVADIRRPSLQLASVDAIVSTNTLQHLPWNELPDIVENLARFLRRGGRLALTLPLSTAAAVVSRLDPHGTVVERRRVSDRFCRWWGRNIVGRLGDRCLDKNAVEAGWLHRLFQFGSQTAERLGPYLSTPDAADDSLWLVWKQRSSESGEHA